MNAEVGATGDRSAVIVLAGGSPHAHDFVATGQALSDLALAAGFRPSVVDDPDRAASALDEDTAALVVDGLWWRMVGEVYEPWRADHAYSPPTSTRSAIDRWVAGGGGLLAVHTASICFDDWPGWAAIVGGAWRWGHSSHPPHGPVEARVMTDHPVTVGLPPVLVLVDEVYGDLAVEDGVQVLATARRYPDDADQPVAWAHRYGAGRVVYDGFGHDVASIEHPDHTRLLTQALSWVARPGGDSGSAADADTGTDLDETDPDDTKTDDTNTDDAEEEGGR